MPKEEYRAVSNQSFDRTPMIAPKMSMRQLIALIIVVALTSLGAYSSCNNSESFSWDGRKGELSVSHCSANGETTRPYRGEGIGPARMQATGRTDNAAVFVELSVDEGTFELQFFDVDAETGKVLRVEGGDRDSLEFELPASVIDRGEYRIVAKDAKGVNYGLSMSFLGEAAKHYSGFLRRCGLRSFGVYPGTDCPERTP